MLLATPKLGETAKAYRIDEYCSIYDEESVICNFRGRSSKSCVLMEKLFSFYAIHGLHSAFRDVAPRMNEALVYFSFIKILLISVDSSRFCFFSRHGILVCLKNVG